MAEAGKGKSEGRWAPCTVTPQASQTLPGASGAPYFAELCWPREKKTIKVEFPDGINRTIKTKTYPYRYIDDKAILEWANVWSSEGRDGIVPKFVLWSPKDKEQSDIRVTLVSGKAGSSSLIGTDAKTHAGEATMFLNLSREDDDYREYVVVHEFGHALGLGHEHQSSHIAKLIDQQKVREYLEGEMEMSPEKAEEKIVTDYAQYPEDSGFEEAEFDPWSVMCYPIPEQCILPWKGKITREVFKMITTQSYAQRKSLSKIDKETIKKLYSSGGANQGGAGGGANQGRAGGGANQGGAVGGANEGEAGGKLEPNDIFVVSEYLASITADNLRSLGMALGLYFNTLRGYGRIPVGEFRELLINDWIGEKDGVKGKGGATWSSLVKALRNKTVSQIGIADKIEYEKIQGGQ